MTFIIALGNNEKVIQISDRRLSCNGRLIDDESNKCGVLFCLNARMAFGYTGLARMKGFETKRWLFKALHDAAIPDYTIGEILERVKINATETFLNNLYLKNTNKKNKRLAVMFSGYINLDGNLKQGCAILSNFHNFKNNTAYPEALDFFSINYSSASNNSLNPTLIQRVGNWRAFAKENENEFRVLLEQNKPSSALIGKAIKVINDMADSPLSGGTIGKQLTSIIIPNKIDMGIESNYHSHYTKSETYMPAIVYLLPKQHLTVENIKVEPVDPDTPPMSVPRVGRNHPCPCGSGKKYKLCHGRIKKS